MNQMLGMNPEEVRSKAALLRSQLSILESAAQTVEYAANSSLNPLSYGIQPGGLIIAPFSIAGTQQAAGRVRAARASVLELAAKLFDEADQQAIVSSGTSASYRGGYVPSVKNPRRPGIAGDAGDILWGALKTAALIESIHGMTMFANDLSWFKKGVSGLSIMKMERALPWKPESGNLPWLRNAGVGKVVGGIGKGFAFLGMAEGAWTIGEGVAEGDGWKTADGILTLALSAGSLIPPPVGPVVAIAGLAYAGGKWVHENWDGIKNATSAAARHVNSAVSTVSNGLANVGGGAASFVASAAEGASNVAKKLWPWR